MSIQHHKIVPVVESDLEMLAAFMFASNLQQATNRFLFIDWPNETAQISLFLCSMKQSFKDPEQEMFKIMNGNGTTIASVVLTRERPARQLTTSSTGAEALDGVNMEVLAAFKSAMTEVRRPMENIDHYILDTIFVKPEVRNEGLGTKLVNMCLERAAAKGLPLFLNSVPSAVGFYRKLGFEETAHVDIDLRQWAPEYGGFGVYRLQGMVAGH